MPPSQLQHVLQHLHGMVQAVETGGVGSGVDSRAGAGVGLGVVKQEWRNTRCARKAAKPEWQLAVTKALSVPTYAV